MYKLPTCEKSRYCPIFTSKAYNFIRLKDYIHIYLYMCVYQKLVINFHLYSGNKMHLCMYAYMRMYVYVCMCI